MDPKHIQLSIPIPCQQRWQDMEIGETGRFCGSCQKTVVNFTAMSDRQISAYFLTKPEKVCGRFTSGQLNRHLAVGPNAPGQLLKHRWVGFVTAGLMSWSTVQGQSAARPEKSTTIDGLVATESPATINRVLRQNAPTGTDSTRVIMGRVIDQTTNEPLPGVTVSIKGTNLGATADRAGQFKFPLSDFQGDSLILVVSFIGFATQEIDVSSARQPLTVALAEDLALHDLAVSVGEVVVTHKPTFFQKLRNRFRANH